MQMASIDIKTYSVCGSTPKSNKSITGEYSVGAGEGTSIHPGRWKLAKELIPDSDIEVSNMQRVFRRVSIQMRDPCQIWEYASDRQSGQGKTG